MYHDLPILINHLYVDFFPIGWDHIFIKTFINEYFKKLLKWENLQMGVTSDFIIGMIIL